MDIVREHFGTCVTRSGAQSAMLTVGSAAATWVAKARCEVGAMCVPEVSRPANCLCASA